MEKTASAQHTEFVVRGLHCGGCVATVVGALESVAGVRGAGIDLETGKTTIETDPDFDDFEALDQSVRDAGYETDLAERLPSMATARVSSGDEAVPGSSGEGTEEAVEKEEEEHSSDAQPRAAVPHSPSPETQTHLRIEGMNCASCVSTVQKALASVENVDTAEVNFATHRARVLSRVSVSADSLVAAVKKSGYGAEVLGDVGEEDPAEVFEAERRKAEIEVRRWRTQALGSGAVSVFLMATMGFSPLAWVHAALATGIQAWAGRGFYRGAAKGFLARRANMDTLISLSTSAAWGYGVYLLLTGVAATHEFMTATMLLTFVSVGKWLEGRGRINAGRALRSLLELAPAKAHRIEGDGIVDVESSELRPGDRCRVLQGERIPTDGRLEGADAEIDESMLTGESLPVARAEGDELFGGTVNIAAPLNLVVERVGSATVLRQIVRRVEEAQSTRPKMQALADAVAAVFVPVVIVIAAVAMAGALALGLGFAEALTRAIAVLIVACPCALGLAVPLAVMAGVGLAARRGIIVRSAETLEISGGLQTVIFDKTGTLTAGTPGVTALFPSDGNDEHALLDSAASLDAESTHPLARAILTAARAQGILPRPLEGVEAVVGKGVRSKDPPLALGSAEFLKSEGVEFSDFPAEALKRESNGETLIGVGVPDGKLIGAIALADEIKPGAAQAIDELHAMGLKTALISGDSEEATRAVAVMLHIDEFHARVAPGEKADAVRAMQEQGLKVAMVGDGINDAPALAQAHLGIAVASGSDIAQEASGLVLLSGDPRHVGAAIRLARAVRAKMIQNLCWAFVYNLALIPLAAFGVLPPIAASVAMAASSVSVVGNALLLYRRED